MIKRILPFVLLFVFMAYLHTYVQLQMDNDDGYYSEVSQQYTLSEFLSFRYQSWTGRMSAEGLIYFLLRPNLNAWKLINSLMVTLLAAGLALLLFGPEFLKDPDPGVERTLWFICLGLGLIHSGVLERAVFWATGSFSYLWPVTAGIAALIPFRWKGLGPESGNAARAWYFQPLFWLAALIACMGNEQVAIVCLALGFAVTIGDWMKHKRPDPVLLAQLAVMLAAAAVLFLAPGNAIRYEAEIQRWFPEFRELDPIKLAYVDLAWILDKLLNSNRALLWLLYVFLAANIYLADRKPANGWIRWITVALFITAVLLTASNLNLNMVQSDGQDLIGFVLYRFPHLREIRQPPGSNFILALRVLPYLVWLPVLALTPLWLAQTGPGGRLSGRLSAVLFCLGLTTLAAMFFSPTIFASGDRVSFVFSVLAVFIVAGMFHRFAARLPVPLLAAIYLYPAIHWILLVVDWRYGAQGLIPSF